MDIVVEDRWGHFITRVVRDGRYGSASDVIREGLRLVEEQEARLEALRQTLNQAIEAGDPADDADIDAMLAAKVTELEARGYRG